MGSLRRKNEAEPKDIYKIIRANLNGEKDLKLTSTEPEAVCEQHVDLMVGIANVTPRPNQKLLTDAIKMAYPEVNNAASLTFVTAVCAAFSHCSKKIGKLTSGLRTATAVVKIVNALARDTEEMPGRKLVQSLKAKSRLIMRRVSDETSTGEPAKVSQTDRDRPLAKVSQKDLSPAKKKAYILPQPPVFSSSTSSSSAANLPVAIEDAVVIDSSQEAAPPAPCVPAAVPGVPAAVPVPVSAPVQNQPSDLITITQGICRVYALTVLIQS